MVRANCGGQEVRRCKDLRVALDAKQRMLDKANTALSTSRSAAFATGTQQQQQFLPHISGGGPRLR